MTNRVNNYVLAMYDIRGKQDFIFRTDKLREIVGASCIIRDCFKDYLFPAALKMESGIGIFHDETVEFTPQKFEEHLKNGYLGEVIYEGGGNFLVIFRDRKTFEDVTYEFTSEVLKKIGTLKILGSYIENVNFDDFEGDREKLYRVHQKNEGMESVVMPWGTLPVVQIDRKTSMQLVIPVKDPADSFGNSLTLPSREYTQESLAKEIKYLKELENRGEEIGEKVLDRIVKEKGEDSLLAVIYIDGNNMGAKVQACCVDKNKGKKLESYEDCVKALRNFSKEIQKNYIDDRKKDIDATLQKLHPDDTGKRRLILGAGDEINFILNAHDAFECAKSYLESLPNGCSSCAGIAVFHSHAPYADAYRIAEECCETGKTLMKNENLSDVCFLDFHYIQSGVGYDLEAIRLHEENDIEHSSKPWLISRSSMEASFKKYTCKDNILDAAEYLRGIGRSNAKGLIETAKTSTAELTLEMDRIKAHMVPEKRTEMEKIFEKIEKMGSEKRRNLIYDMGIVYDLWFAPEEGDVNE